MSDNPSNPASQHKNENITEGESSNLHDQVDDFERSTSINRDSSSRPPIDKRDGAVTKISSNHGILFSQSHTDSSVNVTTSAVNDVEPVGKVKKHTTRSTFDSPRFPVPSGSAPNDNPSRQCWICFASDEDDTNMMWIQPCNCKGTTKWVHQICLKTWINEKLVERTDKNVACPQCKTEYLIYLPKASIIVLFLDKIEALIYKTCPFVAAGVFMGSLYWNIVTLGALMVMQVVGIEETQTTLVGLEPAVLLVGLPIIPASLIVFGLLDWEYWLLHFFRRTTDRVPFLSYVLPGHVVNDSGIVMDIPPTDTINFTRIFAGACVMPVFASMCGTLLFKSNPSLLQRTFLGGAVITIVKGILNMYRRQQNYKSKSQITILDNTEDNRRLVNSLRPAILNPVPVTL